MAATLVVPFTILRIASTTGAQFKQTERKRVVAISSELGVSLMRFRSNAARANSDVQSATLPTRAGVLRVLKRTSPGDSKCFRSTLTSGGIHAKSVVEIWPL